MAAWQKGSSWLSPPHPVQHGADEGERGAGTEGQKPAPLSSWLGLVPAWILTSFQVNVRHAKKHGCHMERAIVALAEDLGCQGECGQGPRSGGQPKLVRLSRYL